MAVKRQKITTPPGVFVYPKINRIYYGSEQFPDPEGRFEVEIILDKTHKEYDAFAAKFDPLYEQAKELAEAKFSELKVDARKKLVKLNGDDGIFLNLALKEMYDEQTEELLPTVRFKAKMRAGGTRKNGPKAGQKWFRRPMAFDAKGNQIMLFDRSGEPLANAPQIWGGSIGRISFEIDTDKDGNVGYFVAGTGAYGVQTQLQAVKVLKLADAQAASAATFGFGEEEDGYSYEADAMPSDESGNNDGTDDGDF